VAGDHVGLHVIDVTGVDNAQRYGAVDTPARGVDIAAAGDYAYVADGWQGLQVLEVSDPASPVICARVEAIRDSAVAVATSGNHAFVASAVLWRFGEGELCVVDVSQPASPVILATVPTPGTSNELALGASHIYVADSGVGCR